MQPLLKIIVGGEGEKKGGKRPGRKHKIPHKLYCFVDGAGVFSAIPDVPRSFYPASVNKGRKIFTSHPTKKDFVTFAARVEKLRIAAAAAAAAVSREGRLILQHVLKSSMYTAQKRGNIYSHPTIPHIVVL